MRKLIFLSLFIPVLGFSQTKNVVSITRMFPKVDKVLEFEKALTAHAQKYHKGDWKWRVFEIQTGPDQGGYQSTEGPLTWESFDKRGNLGTEHNNDYNKTVAIYLTDKSSSSYSVFVDSLSTVALTDYSDKIIINHITPKPGMVVGVIDLSRRLKKVWTASKETVAVYQSINSGSPQLAQVTRLKNGLKELDDNYMKPLPQRYNDVYGQGSWDAYLQDYAKYVDSRWAEILFYRADLSSK